MPSIKPQIGKEVMPKINTINDLPPFRVIRVALAECEQAPYYPALDFSTATAQLIEEQLQYAEHGIAPFWGVVRDGLAQVFLGAYQLTVLKRSHPRAMIAVRVGEGEHFSAADIARLMLHPNHAYPESDVVFRARAIEGLKHAFALSDRQLAEFTGSSRPAIANARRLLGLEPEVLQAAQQGKISYTIARELLTQPGQRQVELVREFGRKLLSNQHMLARIHGQTVAQEEKPTEATPIAPAATPKNNDTLRYERMISEAMGYPTEIQEGQGGQGTLVFSRFDEAGAAHIAQQIPADLFRGRARVVLDYNSFDELDAMLAKLFPPEDDF